MLSWRRGHDDDETCKAANGATRHVVRHNQFDVEGLQSLYRYVQTDGGLKFEKLFRQSERTLDAAAEAARKGPVPDLEEVKPWRSWTTK